jgi:hypothetical protein
VGQLRGDLDLAQESRCADHPGHLRPQDLDSHLTMVLEILGEINNGHATATELALDDIAVGQRRSQSLV